MFDDEQLKNGQMVQLQVANIGNPNKYDATDRIMVFKHRGKHYATGSFCGYDFTDLN